MKMKIWKTWCSMALAAALTFSVAAAGILLHSWAEEGANLAKGKSVTASAQKNDGSEAAANAVDGKTETPWRSEEGEDKLAWICVDLGQSQELTSIKIMWEETYASKYEILLSTDNTKWDKVSIDGKTEFTATKDDVKTFVTHTLEEAVSARYVKVNALEKQNNGAATVYAVGMYELEIYGEAGGEAPVETLVNAAKDKPATASSARNTDKGGAGNAVDGTRQDDVDNNAWVSENDKTKTGEWWLMVDLGKEMTLRRLDIYWEDTYAEAFKVQVSNDEGEEKTWTDVAVGGETALSTSAKGLQSLTPDGTVKARYLRVFITQKSNDQWGVGIFELEAYVPESEATQKVDTAALEKAIADAEANYTAQELEKYTDESVKAYQDALAAAKAAQEAKESQDAVDTAKTELEDAIEGLDLKTGEPESIDTTKLAAAIQAAEGKYTAASLNGYTKDSVKAYQDALAAAKAALTAQTQKAVDDALAALDEAVAGLKARVPSTNNIAKDATATASGVRDNSTPDKVFDGITEGVENAWVAPNDAAAPWWLMVDLGKKMQFDEIMINWEDTYATAYKVLVSDDNKTWKAVTVAGAQALSAASKGEQRLYLDEMCNARYVKIEITGKSNDTWGVGIFELGIYNSGSTTPGTGAYETLGAVALLALVSLAVLVLVRRRAVG